MNTPYLETPHKLKYFFNMQHFVLKTIGLRITYGVCEFQHPYAMIFGGITQVALLFSMGLFSLSNINRLVAVADALSPFLQGLLSFWKVVIFSYKYPEVEKLILRIRAKVQEGMSILLENI